MKKYLYILISLLVFSSCKKFLDVQPESDVTKEQLFSTEEGFKEALNGVYTYCASQGLYGGNLTFSNLDIMAQNYDLTNANYQKVAAFRYSDSFLIGKNDQIWANCYSAIGNCNAILEAIDAKKGIFQDKNYELIKGETLTLRAYLHFDLLRMFAPSFKNNPTAPAIPYVTVVSIKSTAFSNVTEVLTKIIEDLDAAKTLLRVSDPIISAGYVVGYADKTYDSSVPIDQRSTETSNGSLFLQNRRHRMNYYSVCGELARVYLYKEDLANSLLNANVVIDSKKFPWTLKEDFFKTDIGQRDKIFYPELISAWYIPDSKQHLEGLFSNADAGYTPSIPQKDIIYEKGTVGADDWRWLRWFQDVPSSNSSGRAYLQKYMVNSSPIRNMHPLVAPAIRLTEMYYIAAEASFDLDKPKALAYFNTVRNHRGIGEALPADIDKSTFINKLVAECRKEFYGESQIFFMNKRLNKEIINTNGLVYPATNSIFVFPIPLDEQAYRN
ncbi:RagB/SusD family nutrient uptake outer membrane protein [Pedobacter metabolipauper]|uniref:SusD-like starch-binding protein associating with outer membrane n=1 Tax=Pedobacter metabolipauper TaxID=425513 RepID=A0A4R6STC6_9SPHI|nr:RagB/SusD family nutrient uptake outer membrane protein [Pedobacter metabolipauper]TDQ07125.1 SusD-like starch-binding protein associating with outer membrane [Pedobacter metabolipauper]